MQDLKSIYKKNDSFTEYFKNYTTKLSSILKKLESKDVKKVIQLFQDARNNEQTIFLIGNGGSAATCSHFSEDTSFGAYNPDKKPFKTICLADNSPYITALGNDIGYENVFLGQLRCLMQKDDIVVGISGSGNSPNLIKAIEYANKNGGITIGMLGFDGGKMKDICQYNVIVETEKGLYAIVEDIHLILTHMISSFLLLKQNENNYIN